MNELCPFCSSSDIISLPNSSGLLMGLCKKCGASGPIFLGASWGTRPIEDALRAENAKLRAALESLRRGDKEHDNYCACGDPDGLNFCTCSSRNTNAIIDAALKGDE